MKTSKTLIINLSFLHSVKFLGHQIQNNHIHPLKSKTDGFLKLQPPKKKFKIM